MPTQSRGHEAGLISPGARWRRPSRSSPFRDRHWLWGEEWRLGIVPRPVHAILDAPRGLHDVDWLDPPWPGGYACDPWLVSEGPRQYLFFEFYDRSIGKGIIGAGELRHDGRWRLSHSERVIEEPHHLSHPCVFRYAGNWYLIPEAADSGDIVIYESVGFPNRWRRLRSLVPGFAGLDPVFVQHDGRCWLMCTRKGPTQATELHVFSAESLHATWQELDTSPFRSALHRARPAGPCIASGGATLRLAQESRFTYGESVRVMDIESLTVHGLAESPVRAVAPPRAGRYRNGIHSIAPGANITAIDAKRFTGVKSLLGPVLTRLRKLRAQGRDRS